MAMSMRAPEVVAPSPPPPPPLDWGGVGGGWGGGGGGVGGGEGEVWGGCWGLFPPPPPPPPRLTGQGREGDVWGGWRVRRAKATPAAMHVGALVGGVAMT
jgi:hypothetical protein